jgi:hypothetical protein
MWKIVKVEYYTVSHGATFDTFEDVVSSVYDQYAKYMLQTMRSANEQPFPENDYSGSRMIDYVEQYLIFGEKFSLFQIMNLPADICCVAILNVDNATVFAVRTGASHPFPEGPRRLPVEGQRPMGRARPAVLVE